MVQLPGFKRPLDEDYFLGNGRTKHVAQGDIFREVPFPDPTVPEALFVSFGMLLNYTSGMLVGAEGTNQLYRHPYRVVAPLFELAHLQDMDEGWSDAKLQQLRRDDNFGGWMYVPAIPGEFGESGVALFRPTLCVEGQLELNRVTQLTFEANHRLDLKLARVFAGIDPAPEDVQPDMRDHWAKGPT